MFNNITYFFDKVRISLGDSKCPLSERCFMYDAESSPCVSYRGRIGLGEERAPCYKFAKQQIKTQKQMANQKESLFGRTLGCAMRCFAKAEGLENQNLD